MEPKWLALAGTLLDDHADNLGNLGCNDWSWPTDWNGHDRLSLATAMVADNCGVAIAELTSARRDEATNLAAGPYGPPDWWVARFLAKQLQR